MIKDQCGKVYSPGKSLSMDESLVLFKERLSFKQYISSKRARFGIKLYQLCTFNGILLDFHCVSWKLGTRINLLRKLSTDYRENSSNSHAEIPEQGTSSLH